MQMIAPLEPASTDRQICRCGIEMVAIGVRSKFDDAEIRIYECRACGHKLSLMIWYDEPSTGSVTPT